MTLTIYTLDPANPTDILYIPAIARIHLAAWLTVPLMKAIYYGPEEAHPGYLASMEDRHRKAFLEEPNCRLAVVLDDELPNDPELEGKPAPKGKAIAALRYYVAESEPKPASNSSSTEQQQQQDSATSSSTASSRTWAAHSHSALAADFWSHLVAARSFLTTELGKHVLVDNLYTDPAHHRRGAGSMLMRHACAAADESNLPAMLEASPKGLGVYESVGFRRFGKGGTNGKGDVWVDLRRWEGGGDKGANRKDQGEGEGWYAQVLMVRPAKAKEVGKVAKAVDGVEVGKGSGAVV
jgi:GNAT superfamily N-acetyltransferase